MRTSILLAILISARVLLLHAGEGSVRGNIRVFAYSNGSNGWEFFVPEARLLAETNSWDPEREPLSVSIDEFSQKALSYLRDTRKLSMQPRFAGFFSTSVSARASQPTDLKSLRSGAPLRWILVFYFKIDAADLRPGESDYIPVVMLRDGSIVVGELGAPRTDPSHVPSTK